MQFDLFRLCVALGPVAIYLVLVGSLSLSRRSLLVTGTRDAAALGLAVSGLCIVGPLELFFPDVTMGRFGPMAAVALLGIYVSLYVLLLVLALLMLRPRLIVYNISAEQLRSILAETVARLDTAARWAGDSLSIPNLGVQLHLDAQAASATWPWFPADAQQDYRRLAAAGAGTVCGLGPGAGEAELLGLPLLLGGAAMLAALAAVIALNPQAIARSLFEMLQM